MNLSAFTPEALESIRARQSAKAKALGLGTRRRGRPPKIKPEPALEIVAAPKKVGRPRLFKAPMPRTPRQAPKTELNGILNDFYGRKKPRWWDQLVEDARNCPPRLLA